MVPVQEYKIGPNRNYVDGPLIYTVLEGSTDQTTARAYLEIVKKVLREHGEAYLLLNNQQNHLMDVKARREFYDFAKQHKITAFASVGGGVLFRTTLNLVMRALALINVEVSPTAFFSTEPEARAWLEQQRQKHRQQQLHP